MKALTLNFLLILLIGACASCIERPQIEADLWRLEQIPAELCGERPGPLWKIGTKRWVKCFPEKEDAGICHIDDTCETKTPNKNCFYVERISYCAAKIADHGSMDDANIQKWLDKIAPRPTPAVR